MIKIVTVSVDSHTWLDDVATSLNLEVKEDCKQRSISIPDNIGEGTLTAFNFQDGISIILFNCFFTQEFQIESAPEIHHPLQFQFCLMGEFRHNLCDGALTYQLNPYEGSISANPYNCHQRLIFPEGLKVVHTILLIDRKKYLPKVECELDKVSPRFAKAFKDIHAEHSFLYHGNYSIASGDCITEMMSNEYESLVKSAFEEAKALELLSLQLQQYTDDNDPDQRSKVIKKYDLEQIIQAKKLLLTNLADSPTIEELAKQVGINQQKLKTGFKKIYGKPINQYLRNTRLERAKFLILENKYSIKEVSHMVGYANQGHFARRFKEKFGFLPKDLSKSS